MGTAVESRIMDNSTLAKKLHNLIFSDIFCGLCFENGGENSIEQEEVINDDCRPCQNLGEMYTKVFYEKPEDLASNMICNYCMEQLKQSYAFIQNSKSVTKLLYEYVDKLKSKTIELNVQLQQPDVDSTAIIALDYGNLIETENKSQASTQKMTEKITILKKENSVQKTKSHKNLPENGVKNHSAKKHEASLSGKNCSESNITYRSLQEHVKELSSDKSGSVCLKHNNGNKKYCSNIQCQECDETCTHLKHLIHFQEQIQRNPKAKCLDCDFTCSRKETLITHINKQHFDQPYTCGSCSKNFQSKRSFDTHIASHNQLFKCQYCGLDMDEKSILEVHTYFCKERRKISKNQVKESTKNLKESQHCKKTGTKLHIRPKLNQIINKKTLTNSQCPENNITNNTILNPSDIQWKNCSVIKLNNQAKTWTARTKEPKKQIPHLPCELCDFKAWNSILLECHMNRYHLKIKPYVCHICSKDFIGKHLLKKHIKLHTVDRSVTCNHCGKKLANPSCLKSHLKLHTGEKNYPCDICGEKFRSSSIMNVHRVKKHAEKDAACPLCPSKFFTLVELRRHVVKIHWKKDTKFDPRELEGLENHYHLFHDGRRIMMDDQDVDFYLPC